MEPVSNTSHSSMETALNTRHVSDKQRWIRCAIRCTYRCPATQLVSLAQESGIFSRSTFPQARERSALNSTPAATSHASSATLTRVVLPEVESAANWLALNALTTPSSSGCWERRRISDRRDVSALSKSSQRASKYAFSTVSIHRRCRSIAAVR